MNAGQIVDIRWGWPADRRWVRENVSPEAYRMILDLPQPIRRAMSLYRCEDCGEYGVLEGIGDDVLLIWHLKRHRCAACTGCGCDQCRADREARHAA